MNNSQNYHWQSNLAFKCDFLSLRKAKEIITGEK
jgi:hypothetical protein